MNAHLVQLDIAWEDPYSNRARVAQLVGGAHPEPGDLVVLPEMFDTGFSFELTRTADMCGETLTFLTELARQYQITVHGSRSIMAPDGKGRNRSTIVGPEGDLLLEYDKIHPFTLGPAGRREVDHFYSGLTVSTYLWEPANGPAIRVCPAICYDLRFPELFRTGLSIGAELFIVPANWPDTRAFHWRTLLLARAIENQAFVLGVNRTGTDPTPLTYAGGSIAVGPRGDVIAEAGDQEQVLSLRIDREEVTRWRSRFPAWQDRRLS